MKEHKLLTLLNEMEKQAPVPILREVDCIGCEHKDSNPEGVKQHCYMFREFQPGCQMYRTGSIEGMIEKAAELSIGL